MQRNAYRRKLLPDYRAPAILQLWYVPVLGTVYLGWSSASELAFSHAALKHRLAQRPSGLFRFKGFVAHDQTSSWEVQCVGPSVGIKPLKVAQQTRVVGIGLQSQITADQIDAWWHD